LAAVWRAEDEDIECGLLTTNIPGRSIAKTLPIFIIFDRCPSEAEQVRLSKTRNPFFIPGTAALPFAVWNSPSYLPSPVEVFFHAPAKARTDCRFPSAFFALSAEPIERVPRTLQQKQGSQTC
jgi:hypothetical protein